MVMLHGFLQNLDVWSSFTLTYMRHIRVITIDLPGHGYSESYGEVHTMEFMANAVKAVLDHVGVNKCVMAGHSLGGYVALAFAERYVHRLNGLILLHSHAMPDGEKSLLARDEACRMALNNRAGFIVNFITSLFEEKNRQVYSQEIRELLDQCLETKVESIVAAQRGMKLRKSQMGTLASFPHPMLFIYGKQDRRIPYLWGMTQASMAKHAEIALLENVGHMSFIEERQYVKKRMWDFVNQCYMQ